MAGGKAPEEAAIRGLTLRGSMGVVPMKSKHAERAALLDPFL
jgi:hypothetical protein